MLTILPCEDRTATFLSGGSQYANRRLARLDDPAERDGQNGFCDDPQDLTFLVHNQDGAPGLLCNDRGDPPAAMPAP
jgi:hypothetical protein